MILDSKSLKVVILDHNVFITDVIEEILKNYDHELIKINSLIDFNEPCDFLIFYDKSVTEDLIQQISVLPKTVGVKVLILDKKIFVPKDLIPFLGSIVYIDEIDENLKELFDYYSFLKGDKTFEEEVEVLNKLIKDTEQIFNNILTNSKYLEEYLGKIPDLDISNLIYFENLVKAFREEFISFEHFNFVRKIPFTKVDIIQIIDEVIKNRKEMLLSKLKLVKFTPEVVLNEMFINPVILRKLVNNLFDLIFLATKNPQNLFITVNKTDNEVQIRFEINCDKYDHNYKIQLYNPFFPRRVLENYLINYFRIKIEKYHKIFIRDFFVNNKLVFIIILEVIY